ncbi:endonuclease [Bifidobacterium tissieri]|uniref:Endonuclease n=1 Tax=Bifidobacterium tissieri TaxID=1630162 RepID=A0A261FFP0_9BIFI|nr:HNH endonuclease signature motif containing protein [Bifidobacterium tissieri]OZG57835.1 endonuclease [Bifidobacterium tissieri]
MADRKGYARLSNGYWQDKGILKLRRRNPAAALLHVLAISWCSDHATDGRIDEDTLLYVLGATEQDVVDLVASGMLQPAEDEPGMYVLRNYLGPDTRAYIPDSIRLAVYSRDEWKCLRCRSAENLSLDHVHPWSDGGVDSIENFQTLCRSCNSWKGTREIDFRKKVL